MTKTISTIAKVLYLSFVEEFNLIIRDLGALLILLIAVLLYPILYSTAYYPAVLEDIPVAVIDLDHSTLSRKTIEMVDATAKINVVYTCSSMEEAKDLFWKDQVKGIIYIPPRFEKSVYSGQPEKIGVYCDASYFLVYKETLISALRSIGTLSASIEIKRWMLKGVPLSQGLIRQSPIKLKMYNLFNPGSSYSIYVLAGLILVIIQQTLLIGVGLVTGSRRERKKQKLSLEQHTPKGFFWAVVLGRSLVYLLISLFNIMFNFILISYWFDLPFQGEFTTVLYILIPFVMSTAFLGTAISQIFKEREHAIIFLAFSSPIILFLSGLSWPRFMIPQALNILSNVLPSTYVVPAYVRVRTMGVPFKYVSSEFYSLLILCVIYFVLATLFLRMRMSKDNK